ncbi:MAG: hypothetical protein KJ884_04705 [Gammaproteobacteria bacterium]|nr:hypothetical protein [Gammaproteobacteria bacterium]MBU1491208.1 hypothetical protein [Gammaproteobacteria bacterium]MBU2067874.1 hypothetical protein [Gammaproteobacteria bacterium]MBU2139347.1 hypothetical protein [Gammaproteobacteria bacterium]MBU2217219.1 hypothetical protein [Gammaproteobacteria bacterium]
MTLIIGGRRVAKPDDEPQASSSVGPGDYEEAALALEVREALQSKGMLEQAHLAVALEIFSNYVRELKEESFASIDALAIHFLERQQVQSPLTPNHEAVPVFGKAFKALKDGGTLSEFAVGGQKRVFQLNTHPDIFLAVAKDNSKDEAVASQAKLMKDLSASGIRALTVSEVFEHGGRKAFFSKKVEGAKGARILSGVKTTKLLTLANSTLVSALKEKGVFTDVAKLTETFTDLKAIEAYSTENPSFTWDLQCIIESTTGHLIIHDPSFRAEGASASAASKQKEAKALKDIAMVACVMQEQLTKLSAVKKIK